MAFGPLFQKALPVIADKLVTKTSSAPGFRSILKYVDSVAAGNALISKGAENVFKAGAEVLPTKAIPSITRLQRLDAQLKVAQNNPDQFTQNVENNSLGHYAPNQSAAMTQTVGNAVQYLNQQRPNTQPAAPLDVKRSPSSVKTGAYQNALALAEQPALALHKVKQGTITPDDIKHLQALSPAAYTLMQSQLSQALTTHIAKGGSVPYKTRIGMSLFMAQPMDSTLTSSSIQSAQPTGGQPQAPVAGAPKQGKKSSTKTLGNIAEAAATPAQARMKKEGSSVE